MEHWQRDIIKRNLPELIEVTSCSKILLSRLYSQDILTREEFQEIDCTPTKIIKAHMLYELLETRANAYHLFLYACKETKQSGVVSILEDEERKFKLVEAGDNVVQLSTRIAASVSSTAAQQIHPNFSSKSNEIAIGIDFGTGYCCAAVCIKGNICSIKNSMGKTLTPSYVSFRENEVVIGESAKLQSFLYPTETVFDLTRMIGKKWEDRQLQRDIKLWPFCVVNDGGDPKINVNGKLFYPEQILAKLLKSLKSDAEIELQREIRKAVIVVPLFFTDNQRECVTDAGEIAGLEVLEIINEPFAAAMVYKTVKNGDVTNKRVLIFDWGRRSLKVAVLQMKSKAIKVLGWSNDTQLGGDDLNDGILKFCAKEFLRVTGIDVLAEIDAFEYEYDVRKMNRKKSAISRLNRAVENGKRNLSEHSTTSVTIDSLIDGKDLEVEVTRLIFEDINDTLYQRALNIVDKALASSNTNKKSIDDIVLIGGSSRLFSVPSMLQNYFDGKSLNITVYAVEAVAHGASIRAEILLDRGKKK